MRYLGNHPIQVKASPEEKTQSTNLEVNNDKMTQASFNDTFDAMFQDQDDKMDVENENCPLSSTPVSSKKQESRLAKSYTTNKSTSLLGTQERLQLSSWGLPDPGKQLEYIYIILGPSSRGGDCFCKIFQEGPNFLVLLLYRIYIHNITMKIS